MTTKMKAWPKDSAKPVLFEDLIEPLKAALYQFYFLAPRHNSADYGGYNIGDAELASTPDPSWRLSAEGVEWLRDHGRSPADTVLCIAVQLGIEQGRRMLRKEQRHAAELTQAWLDRCADKGDRAVLQIIKHSLTDRWDDES